MQNHSTVFVGLDVHKKSISVAVIPANSTKVEESWQITNQKRAVVQLAKKLRSYGDRKVEACYEADPCGYPYTMSRIFSA